MASTYPVNEPHSLRLGSRPTTGPSLTCTWDDAASGVVTAYGYDARDRLASVTGTGPGPASPVLLSLAYTRTSGGHILSVSEGSGEVRTYTYDDAERLTSESVTQAGVWVSTETFAYDAAGNRTARTWASGAQSSAESSSYDARDRVLSAGGLQCTWDEDGRLQSKAGAQGYSSTVPILAPKPTRGLMAQ